MTVHTFTWVSSRCTMPFNFMPIVLIIDNYKSKGVTYYQWSVRLHGALIAHDIDNTHFTEKQAQLEAETRYTSARSK